MWSCCCYLYYLYIVTNLPMWSKTDWPVITMVDVLTLFKHWCCYVCHFPILGHNTIIKRPVKYHSQRLWFSSATFFKNMGEQGYCKCSNLLVVSSAASTVFSQCTVDYRQRTHVTNHVQRMFKPENVQSAVTSVQQCVTAIEQWMAASRLRLNMDKTELIWTGTKHNTCRRSRAPVVLDTWWCSRCPIRWRPCSRSPTLVGSVTRQARQCC